MAVPQEISPNFNQFAVSQSDAGRELVVTITKSGSGNVTHEVLLAAYRQLTVSGGASKDAGTFAAIGTANGAAFVSGTTTAVFVRLQTTGTPDLTTVAGATLAVVASFAPAL